MSGFIRRFNFQPTVDVLTQIEGIAIIDLTPPGAIAGVGTGVVGVIGEFADMGFAVAVDASGNVTTFPVPTEVFSAQDLATKFGGFDETIGNFGGADGNAFVAVRNKPYQRLIGVAVNLCSTKGVRAWRVLPTNASATLPTPVVPMQAGSIAAAREFKSGANRVRVGTLKTFLGTDAYASGVDGTVTNGAPALTNVFTSASADFVGAGVVKGDVVVMGVIGAAGAQGTNADTYRVEAVTDLHTLVLEKLDGSSFAFATSAVMAYRLHVGATADTGPVNSFTEAGGYLVPARPLDATIPQGTILNPTVAPPAATATTWDPLSGLHMATQPAAALTFTATIQAPNAVNDATIDVLYNAAILSLLTADLPARDVNIVFAARHSDNIRGFLKQFALTGSANGVGREAVLSPQISTVSLTTVVGDAAPGVGAQRDERDIYSWPGVRTFVPEAVGFALGTAVATKTSDGVLDTTFDSWYASILSLLAPERNPGQIAEPVPTCLAAVLGIQRGVSGLGIGEYETMRARGVSAVRNNQLGYFIQSGITSSLVSGQKNVNRRRMADYVEDSLALALLPFDKLPVSNQLKDAAAGEVTAFLSQLLSLENLALQRIAAFVVDIQSGNTPALLAQGVFVIIVRVQMLATADFIVLQVSVSPNGITVTQQ